MKKIYNLLSFIFLFTLLYSCKKDEQKLIVGTWTKTKVEKRIGTDPWEDVTISCMQDDTEEYSESGSWAFYDGTAQCNSGTGIVTGKWELKAGNTKVVYTYTGVAGEYESTVESLDKKKMVLSFSTGNLQNTQMRYTMVKK